MQLSPGAFVDRYELVREVARGGMGQVWEARLRRSHGFEKRFALKTLLPHLASQESFRAMFLDEMRIASGISHPNVCEVLDFGETGDILFLALEWLDGLSLQKWLTLARRLGITTPTVLALRIAADIAHGLHAAHELRAPDGSLLNVVHRDVTPHNLIIRNDGMSKLVDFGIAKARNRIAEETAVGTAKGKLRYMAPEQVRGAPSDRRADVRALGAVLYAMLSGRLPYDGVGDPDMLMLLLRGDPIGPPIAGLRPAVQELLNCALAPNQEDRFGTAKALAQAIEGLHPEVRAPEVQGQIAAFMQYLQGEGPPPSVLQPEDSGNTTTHAPMTRREPEIGYETRPPTSPPTSAPAPPVPYPYSAPAAASVPPSANRPNEPMRTLFMPKSQAAAMIPSVSAPPPPSAPMNRTLVMSAGAPKMGLPNAPAPMSIQPGTGAAPPHTSAPTLASSPNSEALPPSAQAPASKQGSAAYTPVHSGSPVFIVAVIAACVALIFVGFMAVWWLRTR